MKLCRLCEKVIYVCFVIEGGNDEETFFLSPFLGEGRRRDYIHIIIIFYFSTEKHLCVEFKNFTI